MEKRDAHRTHHEEASLPHIPPETLLPHRVRFLDSDCLVLVERYEVGGRTCLELIIASDGELMTTATVNMPEEALGPGEVIIKDYSENEGIMQALADAGVLEDTGRSVPRRGSGFKVARIIATPYDDVEGGA